MGMRTIYRGGHRGSLSLEGCLTAKERKDRKEGKGVGAWIERGFFEEGR